MEITYTDPPGGYNRFAYPMMFFQIKAGQQACPPHHCKETFSEVYRPGKQRQGKTFTIGFVSREVKLSLPSMQEFLNLVEKELDYPLSKIEELNSPPTSNQATSCVAITASTKWLKTQPLLHFFLLLIRNGSGHETGRTWRQTLTKFKKEGAWKLADQPQFLAISKVVPEIVKAKGEFPPMPTSAVQGRTEALKKFYAGYGIVQYADMRAKELKRQRLAA